MEVRVQYSAVLTILPLGLVGVAVRLLAMASALARVYSQAVENGARVKRITVVQDSNVPRGRGTQVRVAPCIYIYIIIYKAVMTMLGLGPHSHYYLQTITDTLYA